MEVIQQKDEKLLSTSSEDEVKIKRESEKVGSVILIIISLQSYVAMEMFLKYSIPIHLLT